ncbi:MAG TPA: RNA-binding cell elongation regulator Jag/EloR [Peptococcaceae bacterium]|jgi:spoIIIJ-associated protein|nr:protein jag [Clostridia bacterium]HOB82028.1 RNA-binding cell elongation regulator Jag/EloR [Peptococcaceae bacterium]HPZ70884.1 RNA-binding cell elongation regulator Jag/EloR [Peptococcaceae bacterium]HQD54230.1 RNA-binding cell elongation regulator Jag/EloR [Peptococcaceae bacterium]
MKSIEISARSVEEAVKMALEELQMKENEVNVEVLEEPSKGFLGILGSKMARVKVTEKVDPLKNTRKFLEDIAEKMGVIVDVVVKPEKGGYITMELVGDDLGILIGRRGDTLDALQYLANLVANKNNLGARLKIILDAENYRARREETLIKLAVRMADKVKKTGRKIVLEPMNPQERRIIHTALQHEDQIDTLSEGEEPFRKVVISLKS